MNVPAEKPENLESVLSTFFGSKAKPIEGGFKWNTPNLRNISMKILLQFDETHSFEVKRSGYGLVIIARKK